MADQLNLRTIFEKAISVGKNSQNFYRKVLESAKEEGCKAVFEYLEKQQEKQLKDIDRIHQLITAKEDEFIEQLREKVTPLFGAWIFTNYDGKLADVDISNIEQSANFAVSVEKEILPFYEGLRDVLPDYVSAIIDNVIEEKKDAVVTLQNLIKELKANIDELLTVALESERLAKKFYINAMKKAQSETGKGFFKDLANFEQSHYNKVKHIIESRSSGKKIDLTHEVTDLTVRPEVEGEFEPNKEEITDVLILAMKAEKGAYERYNKISEMLDDPEGRKIFKNFAQDEKIHQKLLEDEFYSLSNKGTIIWE